MDEVTQHEDWAIVVSGNAKYVGNVTHQEGAGPDWVVFSTCYEYISDLQIAQGPQGQIALAGRTRILVPYDHTLLPCQITVRVDAITWVNKMAPEDAKVYREIIGAAREMAEQMQHKRDNKVQLVPAHALPKGEPPRAS